MEPPPLYRGSETFAWSHRDLQKTRKMKILIMYQLWSKCLPVDLKRTPMTFKIKLTHNFEPLSITFSLKCLFPAKMAILYNHPSYFKSGEINSCRLPPSLIEVTANFILDTLMRSIYIAHQTIQHLDTTCCGERTILPRIPETQIWYSRSHTIHKKEAVCLKSSNDTLENYIFCEYVKFVVISLKKLYFVNNCLINVRTKNPFPHL